MSRATAALAGPSEMRAATATGTAPPSRSRPAQACTAVPAFTASSAMATRHPLIPAGTRGRR